jgi:two-component system, NarL family, sensor kinase
VTQTPTTRVSTTPTENLPVGVVPLPWTRLSRPRTAVGPTTPVRPRGVLLRLGAGLVAVLVLVGLLGALAAERLAEREAVNDAATTADVLAEAVIQPALTEELADGDPTAVRIFDALVRERVLGPNVVRVKIWSPDGTVVYADEPQLVGRNFPLDEDQRLALSDPQTRAEVSDLSASENEFESGGRLLEVYRPVWTPGGRELLFEMYSPYAPVEERSGQLWRGFAGITLSSLFLVVVLTAPIVWRLLRRLREDERTRAVLLQGAVDASDAERRRIAATLHDGPVQELVATTFAAEGAAASAAQRGEAGLADEMRLVASSVRGNIRVLRSLLVDIYPASLARAGLPQALADLGASMRGRQVEVRTDVDPTLPALDEGEERLIHRVAQECLRNAAAHAAPCTVRVTLTAQEGEVVLQVVDDGPGFDPSSLATPRDGHVGTRVLADLATQLGADLDVASAPGAGTSWRLRVPHRGEGARPGPVPKEGR